MAKVDEIQTTFNAGELSPNIDSLIDYEPYFKGSKTLENFIIHPQGWISRRKGSQFVTEVKTSLNKTAIIPFKYNIDQVLIIEVGAGYFRFISNQALVLSGINPYEISNPFTESDLTYIRYVQKDDIIYMTHPTKGIFKMVRLANNNWTFTNLTLLYGPFTKENVVITQTIRVSGSGAVNTNHTMTAVGHTPFTSNHVGGLWLVRDGPSYGYFKITGFTSSSIVTVQPQNILSSANLYNNTALSTWAEGEFSLARSFPRAITFHEGRLCFGGSINETQKIWFSKSNDFENFDIDPNNLSSDDAFNRTIASNTNDSILWLYSDEVLFIGTSGGIWRAKPSNNSAGISNTDISLAKHIAFGSEWVDPVYADDSIFYLQTAKQKIRGIGFSTSKNKYSGEDITIKSDHITGNGIIKFAYQQNPISTIWALREDGQVATFTYESSQEVAGWSRQKTDGIIEDIAIIPSVKGYDEIYIIVKRTINGQIKRFIEVIESNLDFTDQNSIFTDSSLTYNGVKNTNLTLEDSTGLSIDTIDCDSVADIFSISDVGKELHEINGGRGEILAYVNPRKIKLRIIRAFSSVNILSNNWGIAVKKISNLNHLIGMEVQVYSDGATEPNIFIVNNLGEINLNSAGLIIHVGLKYISVRESMPLESIKLKNAIGTSQLKYSRITDVRAKFFATRGGKIDDQPIRGRNINDDINKAIPFTNSSIIELITGFELETTFKIIQDEPQPMNIKSLVYNLIVNQS